ncbi:hypothetical protein JOY44_29850 (plasmid) [Phormidium sp. CLA17]|uniref:hypothetical protein n=1 Tax=Leptolyngbya sp. Cla-17 TaxID=2803751 RepID=UPI001491AB1F|nr:hypothetical protein [Leptolyngbya sp. Cla-17]MBM0745626.1 hypothetical protein [Leptolyngbya sp. Cla-17]
MPQPQPPRSLLDALLAYESHVQSTMPPKQATAAWAQVRTALWRYTLPGWGLPSPQGQRLSPAEYEQGLQLLQQLPFKRLQEAPGVQERLFEQLAVAGNSRRTYRWALQRLMTWCQQQGWLETALVAEPASRVRQHRRSANDVRLTTRRARQRYRLVEAEQSEALRQELALFTQFLTGAGAEERDSMGVSAATAQQYLHQVERFLGWLHSEGGVPLQELSLRQLVVGSASSLGREQPVLPSEAEAERVVALVQAYLEWLRTPQEEHLDGRSEAVQSPYTALRVINALFAVVRFVYRQDSVAGEQEAEPAQVTIAALQELRKVVYAQLKTHQAVSDESKKRLEWPEFLNLVETLRGECVSQLHQSTQSKQGGVTLAPPRSLTAIAQSYQRFLLFAFLAYMPPRRSNELRKLTFSQLPRPHRPVRKAQALDGEASVLYPDQQGWWIKRVDQKLKGPRSPDLVLVPNLSYTDGRCFYQYLEEWLLHYVYQDGRGKTVAVPGLRSCFNPHHQRLFTLKKGEPYPDAVSFSKLLRFPAYRFTGKALDFHTVRGIYAAYSKHKEDSSLASANSVQDSEDEVLSKAFAALDIEKEQYDPADWSKAAVIAQAFLNQLV